MTEALTQSELAHYTNLWCKSKGISSRDLTLHPRIDDIILLLAFREAMWSKLNKAEQGCWSGYWSSIYHKRNKLKLKAFKKLEQITITAEQRHISTVNMIRQIRQNPYSKSADNIVAKDAGPTHSGPWE